MIIVINSPEDIICNWDNQKNGRSELFVAFADVFVALTDVIENVACLLLFGIAAEGTIGTGYIFIESIEYIVCGEWVAAECCIVHLALLVDAIVAFLDGAIQLLLRLHHRR